MLKKFKSSCYFLLFIVMIVSCNAARLYTQNKYENGLLKPADLDSLKSLLSLNSTVNLRDTIIIKYDFNNDDCWQFLDKQKPAYITNVMSGYQNRVREKSVGRPDVAIYQYREAGSNFSKYKKHNVDIKVDDGYIRKLLFRKRATCGSSAIILPSGKYILLKSDSHFQMLNLSTAEIKHELNK